MNDFIKRQYELRQNAWEQAKGLLDTAFTEGRDLTADEQQTYDRINEDIDARNATIERLEADFAREARAAEQRLSDGPVVREERQSDADILRAMARGEIREYTFEKRQMTTSTDAAVVPQDFWGMVESELITTGPALEPGVFTILRTDGAAPIKMPRQTAFSQATATAEGAVFTASNPTTDSVTISAFKYGTLVSTSRELLEDAGVDVQAFLARQIGVALGTAINSVVTLGTGTVEPRGIVPNASLGVTGGTGVSGAFTAAALISLAHSIDAAYARRPGVGFMLNRKTLGQLRAIQDGGGAFVYNPVVGGAETLLGYRVIQNPAMVDTAVNAKSVLFGDFSAFYVRTAGGLEIARSDDYGFATDTITWRASIRLDSVLPIDDAVKYFVGGTA
jgi:HK97 family phage major capsid protein